MSARHHQIVIVGGGNAGISVAARLLRANSALDIAVVEPSEYHYYQPAWTLVAGGEFDNRRTVRPEIDVMPERVQWYRTAVTAFEPEASLVHTAAAKILHYDFLIVAPGIQLNWDAVKGLPEALGHGGVCSNYGFGNAVYTAQCLREFTGGRALFTSPGTPVKCGGAPQKVMYLAADQFRRRGLLERASVEFYTAGKVIFGVRKYAESLQRVVDDYGIHMHFRHDLVELRPAVKEAVFRVADADGGERLVTDRYDMIHVTPPQSAPDVVCRSALADANGWVDVQRETLRHVRFPNVYSLGDVANSPNAKTGAAVRKQAPVVVANVLGALRGAEPASTYSGYGSCPLITGYGRLILAEFDWNNQPMETFPFDQAKPRWSMYQLKKHLLPWLYWNRILKGTA